MFLASSLRFLGSISIEQHLPWFNQVFPKMNTPHLLLAFLEIDCHQLLLLLVGGHRAAAGLLAGLHRTSAVCMGEHIPGRAGSITKCDYEM